MFGPGRTVLTLIMCMCVAVENESHCDFVKLREMLIRVNMEDLREQTHARHYELYRRCKLEEMGFKDTDPDSQPFRWVTALHYLHVKLISVGFIKFPERDVRDLVSKPCELPTALGLMSQTWIPEIQSLFIYINVGYTFKTWTFVLAYCAILFLFTDTFYTFFNYIFRLHPIGSRIYYKEMLSTSYNCFKHLF